jgi:hypothetical protein
MEMGSVIIEARGSVNVVEAGIEVRSSMLEDRQDRPFHELSRASSLD